MNDLEFKAGVIWLSIMVLGFIGWIVNIVKLLGADVMGTLEVVRAIGIIVAPLGAFMGIFI